MCLRAMYTAMVLHVPAYEVVPEGQHSQRGVAASAAAINAQPAAIHQALVSQVARSGAAVVDVSHAPVAAQPVAVGPAKA